MSVVFQVRFYPLKHKKICLVGKLLFLFQRRNQIKEDTAEIKKLTAQNAYNNTDLVKQNAGKETTQPTVLHPLGQHAFPRVVPLMPQKY